MSKTQGLERLPEAGDRVGDLTQSLHVGQVATCLDREEEVARDLLDPPFDRGELRQPVEGGVDLDRVEDLGVALQPAPLRQPVRVEATAPVPIAPARATDPHPLHRRFD
jgi:hypothetical protein